MTVVNYAGDFGVLAPPLSFSFNSEPKKSQADKFREAAKQVETDDDEKRFDERLKDVAKMPSDRASGKQKGTKK